MTMIMMMRMMMMMMMMRAIIKLCLLLCIMIATGYYSGLGKQNLISTFKRNLEINLACTVA